MAGVLDGIRVLEVASFGFVPSAGAVLADWGAEVLKVEHPQHPDPMRTEHVGGMQPGQGGFTFMWELINRGKRGIAIDLKALGGREVLFDLIETSDVFLTNFLPVTRKKLGIDVQDVMERNPGIVYARGSGQGPRGPESDDGGFDSISYWYRTGASSAVSPPDLRRPLQMPGPAFGDIQSGLTLAGGVGTALGYRARTGKGVVVDVSLYSTGSWAMQAGIVGTQLIDADQLPVPPGYGNPFNQTYRTSDGRFVAVNFVQSDRYWERFCELFDRTSWIDDPRLSDSTRRRANYDYCVTLLEETFVERSLEDCARLLDELGGQWQVVKKTGEVRSDEQARANGYVQDVVYDDGRILTLVSAPTQFDETPPTLRPAPDHGADTRDVLKATGYSAQRIDELEEKMVIG